MEFRWKNFKSCIVALLYVRWILFASKIKYLSWIIECWWKIRKSAPSQDICSVPSLWDVHCSMVRIRLRTWVFWNRTMTGIPRLSSWAAWSSNTPGSTLGISDSLPSTLQYIDTIDWQLQKLFQPPVKIKLKKFSWTIVLPQPQQGKIISWKFFTSLMLVMSMLELKDLNLKLISSMIGCFRTWKSHHHAGSRCWRCWNVGWETLHHQLSFTKPTQCLKFNLKEDFYPRFSLLSALDCKNCRNGGTATYWSRK